MTKINLITKCYRVTGMTCGGCAQAVQQAIQRQQPQATVTVDLAAQQVTVAGIDNDQIVAHAVEQAGFRYEGVVTDN